MSRYFIRRVIQAIPTLFVVTVVSFLLLHLVPGGPAEVLLGNKATPALIARLNRSLGLDRPLYVQYGIWLWQLLHGNLGYAYSYHQSVISLIGENLPRTLLLVITAFVISHILAILIGVYQASHRNSVLDHALTALAYFFYAMPTFWLGVVAVSVFAVQLRWLPAGGFANAFSSSPTLGSTLRHLVLPAGVLVVVTVAGWSRYMRAAMSDALVQDYIRTARAKGVSRTRILWVHALRNSLLSLITLAGMSIPTLVSGALIIEMIFDYPGMGLLFWNAAQQRDYPVLLGVVVLVGTLTIVGNLAADLLYAVVDPRIKFQ